ATGDDRGDDGGVEPPRQVGPDRKVGSQLQPHGIDEQRAQLLGATLFRSILERLTTRKAPVPPALNVDPIALDRHAVAGRKLSDALEDARRRQGRPVAEDRGERCRVEAPWNLGQREQRLDLGREGELSAVPGVEERANADAVACEQQPLPSGVPETERELAVQLLDE